MRRSRPLRLGLFLAVPFTVGAALAANPSAAAGDDPVKTTFLAAKSAYKEKRWPDADVALSRIRELLAAPEHAWKAPQVLPALHFYSAAVAWAEKDEERARAELTRFFEYQPDAGIDPGSYPKSFVVFFEARRNELEKQAAERPRGPEAMAGGALPDYATRDVDTSAIPLNTGAEDWIDSPVSTLLTDAERKTWKSLATDDDRRSFVSTFWRVRDPRPDTVENEFQIEFYRRVQYADANLSTEATRGALSDRGKVFLVLGPPTYAGRTPLRRSQDIMNYLRTTEVATIATDRRGGRTLARVPSNRAAQTPGEIEGEVETWYYRRDRIPAGVPFNELQYMFITRTGYGQAVLQREARELTALAQAARLLMKSGAANEARAVSD